MKQIYLLFIVLTLIASLNAQDISGSWTGQISVGATKIRLGFVIKNGEIALKIISDWIKLETR